MSEVTWPTSLTAFHAACGSGSPGPPCEAEADAVDLVGWIELRAAAGRRRRGLPSRLTTITNGLPFVPLIVFEISFGRHGVAGDGDDLVASAEPGGRGRMPGDRAADGARGRVRADHEQRREDDDREEDVRPRARRRSRRRASRSSAASTRRRRARRRAPASTRFEPSSASSAGSWARAASSSPRSSAASSASSGSATACCSSGFSVLRRSPAAGRYMPGIFT